MRLHALTAVLLLAVLAPTAALASPARHRHVPDPHAADLKFIKAAYAYQDYGWRRMDVAEALAYTTDDYTSTAVAGGILSKGAITNQLYSLFVSLYHAGATITVTTQVLSASFRGNAATVITECSAHASKPDTAQPAGTPRAFDANGYYDEDTWVRSARGWALQNSHEYAEGQVMPSAAQ
jgi:hypothetical protein